MDRGSGSGGGDKGGGVNLPLLRGHNDARVLDLLRAAGPGGLGRADLADRTGLTPQAVSKITARLRGDGLVADAGREASTGGKPRTLLKLVREARYAVGVHLDRDELTAVRVDLAGRVVADWRGPLDFGAGPDVAVEEAVRAVHRVCGGSGGVGGGGVGGPVLGVGVTGLFRSAAAGPSRCGTEYCGSVTTATSARAFSDGSDPARGPIQLVTRDPPGLRPWVTICTETRVNPWLEPGSSATQCPSTASDTCNNLA
ncbi:hypothetical protein DRB89_40975 [Streptomyces sp. ICC4]|nr:hypothetical protein DRB89_40975 [Streptomyces sp. ICC4]